MPYQKGSVSKTTKILFPIVVTMLAGLVAPASVALVGFPSCSATCCASAAC